MDISDERKTDGGQDKVNARYRLDDFIGRSPKMLAVYKVVAKAAESRATVLIQGETGTGKELIAQAIHYNGPRASSPFLAVDCSTFNEGLLESELFGYVQAAFTGAVEDKKGIFEEADGGTIFLDEIGDIAVPLQAMLLRVLQEHEIRRVGSFESIKVDVRIIAATSKNLENLIQNGTFRSDLYYRLSVINIVLPPLRERKEDILPLAEYFLRKYSAEAGKSVTRLSPQAMELMLRYSWPGNIRELENAIERAVTMTSNSLILPEDIPPSLQEEMVTESSAVDKPMTIEEMQRNYIRQVLNNMKGNKKNAAKKLGIDRKNIYRMLQKRNSSQSD